jgi:anthranilate synthase component 2
MVDNYDSFTFNLVQYLGELGADVDVRRNDRITPGEIEANPPGAIVLSPGPGRPEDAGATLDIIRCLGARIPILGVCLGHQAIGLACGGRVIRAPRPVHGKTSRIRHDGAGVFAGLGDGFDAARYHSLVVADEGWPTVLVACARAVDDGVVMGLRHRVWPVHGVQFHPESVLTGTGHQILRNFLDHEASQEARPRV